MDAPFCCLLDGGHAHWMTWSATLSLALFVFFQRFADSLDDVRGE
jgi:hypothetical protein